MKINLLIALAILTNATLTLAQLPNYVPTNGLFGWWGFSGNTNDESINANNGTIVGTSTFNTDRFNLANSTFQFANSGDIICTTNSSNNPQVFTYSFWFKGTTPGWIIGFEQGQCTALGIWDRYASINSAGNLDFRIYLGSGQNANCTTSASYLDGSWHHAVFGLSSAGMKIYVDGTLAAQNVSASTAENHIGYWRFGGLDAQTAVPSMTGKLDDIGIWNRVLTNTEIQQLYNGCTTAPVASITAYGNTTFCTGDNVYLVASPATGVTYQWQKNSVNISGATAKAYTAKTTGAYRCVVTNACGTSTSNAISVTTLPLATVTISTSTATTFCAGDSVTFTGTNPGAGYTYQWYKGSVSINGATGLSYVAYSPGSYKMVNKNTANGCSRISNSKSVAVNCRIANPNIITGSGFDNNDIDNAIRLYPNPSAGSFTLELNDMEDGIAKIELVNSIGQTVYKDNVEIVNNQLQKQMELKNISHGLHIMRVIVNDKLYESKVIIN